MDTFDHLFILGRPASGKSEFLDFMTKLPAAERADRFNVGDMTVQDDFVWLWEKFEEDDLWEKIKGERLHSKRAGEGYILDSADLFDFLMEKFNFEITKKYLGDVDFYDEGTLLIEFSRGGERPYAPSLGRLSPEIYERAAILYIDVTGEESTRRNEARYQEKLKHSVLAHKCPDEDMERFYRNDDWQEITEGRRDGLITLSGVKVPFVTMGNEPESKEPKVLGKRYGDALRLLWSLTSALNDSRERE
jgi:hypothetical protein